MRMTVALFALLAGCASSSGVHTIGPELFTITTNASGGRGGIQATRGDAIDEAQASCQTRAKQAQITREVTTPPSWNDGMAHTTIDFICVTK